VFSSKKSAFGEEYRERELLLSFDVYYFQTNEKWLLHNPEVLCHFLLAGGVTQIE
jgi:hypothetical protein